jgi:hypothetical protein
VVTFDAAMVRASSRAGTGAASPRELAGTLAAFDEQEGFFADR